MAGFNTLPAVGGGGSQPNMTYVGSVHMSTYNRSWAQAGTAGYYAMYSSNQETGYVYYVGSGTSTGVPMNRVANISHAFTRIDIIGSSNDMVNLYKAKVKATTSYANPFIADASINKSALSADAIVSYFQFGRSSFPVNHTSSGTFNLPSTATPLINVLIVGAGAAGGNTHCGGGGGAGNVIKLTGFPAVTGTTVTVGQGSGAQGQGGTTYFGSLYALGGGYGGDHNYNAGSGANGGGGPGHRTSTAAGTGTTQTSTTGVGTDGSPLFFGGHSGGTSSGADTQQSAGGGGGGAAAAGAPGNNSSWGAGGAGHQTDISGVATYYGHGGSGGRSNAGSPSHGESYVHLPGSGGRGAASSGSAHQNGANGIVIARYFIS